MPREKPRPRLGDEVLVTGCLVDAKLNDQRGVVLEERGGGFLLDLPGGRRVVLPRYLTIVREGAGKVPKGDLRALLQQQEDDFKKQEKEFSEYREDTFRLADRPPAAEPRRRPEDIGSEVMSFMVPQAFCVFADPDAEDGGVSSEDVLQKRLQDSYLLGVLAALTRKEQGRRYLRSIVRLSPKQDMDAGAAVCSVRFLRVDPAARRRGDRQLAEWVPVTALLPAHTSEKKPGELVPLYAKCKARDESGRRVLWPSLVEKAWVVYQEQLFPSHAGSGDYAFVDAQQQDKDTDADAPADGARGAGVHATLTSCCSLLGCRGEQYLRRGGRIPLTFDVLCAAVSREDRVVIASYGAHVVPIIAAQPAAPKARAGGAAPGVVRVRDQAAPASERYTEYDFDSFVVSFHSVRVIPIPGADDVPTVDYLSPRGSPRVPLEPVEMEPADRAAR